MLNLSPKVENIVQEIQNPVCVNSRNSRNYLENIHILGIPGIFGGIPGISGFLGNQWRSKKYWDFPRIPRTVLGQLGVHSEYVGECKVLGGGRVVVAVHGVT